jgi:hypothetical protein
MYFLDVAETQKMLTSIGFSRRDLEKAMGPNFSATNCVTRNTRADFVNSYVAATAAIESLGYFTSVLMFIYSMGARPSIENTHLFERLRLSYGERRPNFLVPGYVFQSHDRFALTSFCDVAVNGGFRAVIVQHVSRSWIALTEDDEIHFLNGSH